MTTQRSDLAVLAELHAELQKCSSTEFERRRSHMVALVEELRNEITERNWRRGDTIEALQSAFLEGVQPGKTLSLKEHAARSLALEEKIAGLDVVGLLHLFFCLEYQAANMIYSLYALAQTVDPARIKEQCPWLPDSLVHDAIRALKANQIKAGHSMQNKGKELVRIAWIDAGLHKRRARYGELDKFCQDMARQHDCAAETIKKNWIPSWRRRKELPPT